MHLKGRFGITDNRGGQVDSLHFNTNQTEITMRTLDDVYLSMEQFEKELDYCLTIIEYPSKAQKYYVCEHISAALERSQVKVFVLV